MTPDQFQRMQIAARNLLAHRDCGRKCDPEAVRWAETLLRNNAAWYSTMTRAPAFAHAAELEGDEA